MTNEAQQQQRSLERAKMEIDHQAVMLDIERQEVRSTLTYVRMNSHWGCTRS